MGNNYKIILSKFIVSIPHEWMPKYVQELDSYQREFLEERLPDNLQILLEPQTIEPDQFEGIKGTLSTYLQGGRIPGFNGKALLPQAASLCRSGLS